MSCDKNSNLLIWNLKNGEQVGPTIKTDKITAFHVENDMILTSQLVNGKGYIVVYSLTRIALGYVDNISDYTVMRNEEMEFTSISYSNTTRTIAISGKSPIVFFFQ